MKKWSSLTAGYWLMTAIWLYMGIYSVLERNFLVAAFCFNAATVWAGLAEK